MDNLKLLGYVKDAGAVGVLAFALFGSYSGVWVWGSQYNEVKAERDKLMQLALEGNKLTNVAVAHAENRPVPMMTTPTSPSEVTVEDIAQEQSALKKRVGDLE